MRGKQIAAAALALTFAVAPAFASAGKNGSTDAVEDEKVAVVKAEFAAWNRLDFKAASDLFAEDGVFRPMAGKALIGRAAIAEIFALLGAGYNSVNMNVINMGRVGDVVFAERLDSFVYKGHAGKVPIVGVLTIENGKIKEWREYNDHAQFLRETGITKIPEKSDAPEAPK